MRNYCGLPGLTYDIFKNTDFLIVSMQALYHLFTRLQRPSKFSSQKNYIFFVILEYLN